MQTTTTFAKSIEMQFARDGKRTKLTGFVGQLTDESGVVLHSALYETKPAAELALDALAHELLIDYAERGLVDELPGIEDGDGDGPGGIDLYAAAFEDEDDYADAVQCDICDNDRVIRADNGRTTPCPYCSTPITIGQRFSHLGFGAGTVIAITDDEHLNVQVKFDSPSRFGSKFWFDTSEVTRARAADDVPTDNPDIDSTPGTYGPEQARAVSLQSRAIDARITTCANCKGIHHIQRCPSLRAAVAVPMTPVEMGASLCGMLWCDPAKFVRLLTRSTTARRTSYAAAYIAFLRSERGWCDVTIADVLAGWLPTDRSPAMIKRAA